MPYLLAALCPPLALLWCRKPWQALLSLLLLLGAIAGAGSGALGEPLPTLLGWGVVLWAVGAVAQRRVTGRAARRIREAWGGPTDAGS